MSNINKREPLVDEDLEQVTGGNVQFVCIPGTTSYCYGEHNPDVKYTFNVKIREVSKFIAENYDYYGEAGIFNAMVAAGLISPM